MRYLVPATDVPKRLDELEVPGLSKTRPEVPKPKKVPCRARNANRCRSDSTDWTTGTRATRFAPRQVLSGVFCPRPSADLALPGIPEGAEGDVKSSNSVSANWSRHVCELATGATILGFSTAQPFDVMVSPLQIERVYAFARRGQTFSEFQISAHLVTLDTLRSTRVPSGVVSIARQHAASRWYGLRHGASGESVIETGVSPAPGVGLFLAGSYCPAGEPPGSDSA
jgi:hypothetical protein